MKDYDNPPRYRGYSDYHADRLIVVDGETIGGTYYCCADYVPNRKRWASWGPAGWSRNHPNRAAAEAAQLAALSER